MPQLRGGWQQATQPKQGR